MAQCTATSKTTGERCKQSAKLGSTKCHYHGGATPKGIASPHTTHGRYSKYLPTRLLERYGTATQDDQLLVLRDEIAVIESRLGDLLLRVDTGEAGAAWKAVRKAHDELAESIHSKDSGKMLSALRDMDRIIGRGMADYAAWGEVYNLLEQRRKLVESERKREIEAQQHITAQEALLLVSALLDSVKRNVTDPIARTAIQTDFIQLTTRQDSERISSAD